MFAAIRHASSFVSSLAADRRPAYFQAHRIRHRIPSPPPLN
jgi:hypothetical protein